MHLSNVRHRISAFSWLGLLVLVSAGACSSQTSREEEEEAGEAVAEAVDSINQICPGTIPLIYCGSITVPADASCHGYGALSVTKTCNLAGPLTCLQGLHLGDVPSIPQSAPPGPYPLGKTPGIPVTCTGPLAQASCKEAVTVVDLTAPVITCPGNQVLSCSRVLPDGTAATATDNCSVAPPSCDHSLTDPFPDGSTTVTCSAADGSGNTSSCQFDVTVKPDTAAPQITCPGDQILGCDGTVTLPTATDDCGGPAPVTCVEWPESSTVTAYSCSATDDSWNVSQVCSFTATTGPQSGPIITVGTPVVELWPPNHKPYDFDLTACGVSAVDACGVCTTVDPAHARIERITSDEPEDANGNGDGHTCNDIVLGGDGFSATLLAERDGGARHNGRVYTVYFTVKDSHGNASSSSCEVQVPHDKEHAVVKDACQLCVGSGCGACPGHDASCTY